MNSQLAELAGQLTTAANELPHEAANALSADFDQLIARCQSIVGGTGHDALLGQLQGIRDELVQTLTDKLGAAKQVLEDTAQAMVRG